MAHTLSHHTKQGLFWGGLALILLGIWTIASPWVSSYAITFLIGLSALISGALYIVHAFYDQHWSGFFWSILVGLLALAGGWWLMFNPIPGLIALSLVLAATIFFQGLARIALSLYLHKQDGWFWLLLSGIVGAWLGWYIWYYLRNYPLASSAQLVALLFGIDFIFTGISFLMLSQKAKRHNIHRDHPDR